MENDTPTPQENIINRSNKGAYVDGNINMGDGTYVSSDFNTIYQTPLTIIEPPAPAQVPSIQNFEGREVELAQYADQLQKTGIAVITGMAGVGKTALAAELTRQYSNLDKTFWHTFFVGESVESILWKLAAFLAVHNRPELWQVFQSSHLSDHRPPPLTVLVDYTFQLIRTQDYLLCFDDLHIVDDDPLLAKLMELLMSAASAGKLGIIIISRRIPNFVQIKENVVLQGLTRADTGRLLKVHGLQLTDKTSDAIHERTEGNPQLLILAAQALRRSKHVERVVDNLAQVDDIETYLLTQIDGSLSNSQKYVMSGVAIFLGFPATPSAIEEVIGSIKIRRELHFLLEQNLVNAFQGEQDAEYTLGHSILQVFYYDLLGHRERQELHRRAAAYYETQEVKLFRATQHYFRASEQKRAAELIGSNIRLFVSQGYARLLDHFFDKILPEDLPVELAATFNLARGWLYTWRGASSLARQSFEQVLALTHQLPDTSISQTIKTQIYLNLGDLLQQSAPQDAIDWLRKGLEETTDRDNSEAAALYITLGAAYINIGNLQAALQVTLIGQAVLPVEATRYPILAEKNLSTIYYYLGKFDQAQAHAQNGARFAQQQHDILELYDLRMNLAMYREINGDWQGAIDDCIAALAQSEQWGSIMQQVRVHNLLGVLYTKLGDELRAKSHTDQALDMARKHQLDGYIVDAHTNQANIKLQIGDWQAARLQLAEALSLATALGYLIQQVRIHNSLGLLYTRLGEDVQAQFHINQALEIAQQCQLDAYTADVLANQVQLYLQQNDLHSAHVVLTNIEFQLSTQKFEYLLPLFNRLKSAYYLAVANYIEAKKYALRAYEAVRNRNMVLDEGWALAQLGHLQMALDQPAQGNYSYQQSLNLLEKDPYAVAHVKATWGSWLISLGYLEQGRKLISEASTVFERLNAKHDLTTVNQHESSSMTAILS